MVMVMWLVDVVFKTDTLSLNIVIQAPLRILVGMLTRVMLLVDMVLWTAILIYNIMVNIFSKEKLDYDELVMEVEVESSDGESECNEKYVLHMTWMSLIYK